jgi:hypothetical protein
MPRKGKMRGEIWGVCEGYRLLNTEDTEKNKEKRDSSHKRRAMGQEILTPQASFEMTNDG